MSGPVVLNAKGAIARHVQWKIALQTAIVLREALSASQLDQIRHHRRCAIGLWLDSAATLRFRSSPAYLDLVRKHIGFHHQMERVAVLIGQQSFEEAGRQIKTGSGFHGAALALALAMTVYDQISPIAVPA
jgi:hypothetical protein